MHACMQLGINKGYYVLQESQALSSSRHIGKIARQKQTKIFAGGHNLKLEQ